MFQEGDVVQLKSGGPRMTVSIIETKFIICTWFDDTNLKDAKFTENMLKKI